MDYGEVNLIEKQFHAGEWPQFLRSLAVSGLHGLTGQTIEFAFPVCAIVGENGTGKSTILKAAACAYEREAPAKAFFPTDFFMETRWDKFTNVSLAYTVRNGPNTRSYTMRKPNDRWSYKVDRPSRAVFFLDISRTVPLDGTIGYAKIAKQGTQELSSSDIDPDYRERLSHILGKVYENARFALSDADKTRDVGLLKSSVGEISQFHQGAGEDAMLDLMRVLQGIPKYSLLIIDEVENSLHPRAQRRLMRSLLWLSRQRRIQIILSTHSPYILEELPPQSRILLLPDQNGISVVSGISAEFALTRLDDLQHPEMNIFVEDRESEELLAKILSTRADGRNVLSRSRITPVGASSVVKTLGQLGTAKSLPYPSIGVLDADEAPYTGCARLPGVYAPEVQVFKDLKALKWEGLTDAFNVGAGELFGWLDDAMLDPDPHRWPSLVGNKVAQSKNTVWVTMCHLWAKRCLTQEAFDEVLSPLKDRLDGQGELFPFQRS